MVIDQVATTNAELYAVR